MLLLSTSDALSTYLDDHRAGAAAGEQLAERLAESGRDEPWADDLRSVADQVAEDVRTLDEIREALGIDGGAVKKLVALVGGYVTRWRPDRVLLHGDELPRVLDLEAMIAGVAGKRQLWSLLGNVGDDARLAAFDFAALERRANEQIELLRSVHRQASDRLTDRSDIA